MKNKTKNILMIIFGIMVIFFPIDCICGNYFGSWVCKYGVVEDKEHNIYNTYNNNTKTYKTHHKYTLIVFVAGEEYSNIEVDEYNYNRTKINDKLKVFEMKGYWTGISYGFSFGTKVKNIPLEY
jgi:methyltransferase-like protein